jgi:structural maintenance of chromosome 1
MHVEERLQEVDQNFNDARREAKLAKEKFHAVKQRRLVLLLLVIYHFRFIIQTQIYRYKLFHDAYQHIASRIDEIYKDLTKSKNLVGGTAYLSLEDTEVQIHISQTEQYC